MNYVCQKCHREYWLWRKSSEPADTPLLCGACLREKGYTQQGTQNVNDLIAKAKVLLEGIEPTPWNAGQGCVYDAEGYVVATEVYAEDRDFIVAAPDLVRELVKALKEAVGSAEEWKGRAEYHKEWSEYHSEKWDEARKLNGRDPNEPR